MLHWFPNLWPLLCHPLISLISHIGNPKGWICGSMIIIHKWILQGCWIQDQLKSIVFLHVCVCVCVCVCVLVAQPCPPLCETMDCSLPGSSVHGILQARILEWVAIPFSRRIFPNQGSNLDLPHCRSNSLVPGSPEKLRYFHIAATSNQKNKLKNNIYHSIKTYQMPGKYLEINLIKDM